MDNQRLKEAVKYYKTADIFKDGIKDFDAQMTHDGFTPEEQLLIKKQFPSSNAVVPGPANSPAPAVDAVQNKGTGQQYDICHVEAVRVGNKITGLKIKSIETQLTLSAAAAQSAFNSFSVTNLGKRAYISGKYKVGETVVIK